jgi:hypothetical protein
VIRQLLVLWNQNSPWLGYWAAYNDELLLVKANWHTRPTWPHVNMCNRGGKDVHNPLAKRPKSS